MTRSLPLLALAALPLLADDAPPRPAKPVALAAVDYDGLGKAIRDLRGKVVVVDIWATWCPPCKREFPELVKLHDKYAPDGLACVSVSVDEAKNEAAALTFLKQRRAAFLNLRVEGDLKDLFEKKWAIASIPAVFVFDRGGFRAAKFSGDGEKGFGYDKDVEPLVRKLLAAKK